MQHELRKRGLRIYPPAKIDVFYDFETARLRPSTDPSPELLS
jgi:hypothetical protein